MPFDSWNALQDSILGWLGRPGDPLVLSAVPDFIALFEEEARGRLRTMFSEKLAVELPPTVPGTFALPDDFAQMRRLVYDGHPVEYMPPAELHARSREGAVSGTPLYHTIEGLTLTLAPVPDTNLSAFLDYWAGLPALGPSVPSNWLLARYPSLYLFGSLVNFEAYIGDDERVSGWLQQREASFERVRREAVAASLGGAPLVQRVDGPTP